MYTKKWEKRQVRKPRDSGQSLSSSQTDISMLGFLTNLYYCFPVTFPRFVASIHPEAAGLRKPDRCFDECRKTTANRESIRIQQTVCYSCAGAHSWYCLFFPYLQNPLFLIAQGFGPFSPVGRPGQIPRLYPAGCQRLQAGIRFGANRPLDAGLRPERSGITVFSHAPCRISWRETRARHPFGLRPSSARSSPKSSFLTNRRQKAFLPES